MKPCLNMVPCLEMGNLRVNANLQDPDVRLSFDGDDVPCIRLEEGGVIVVLEFPDLVCLTRFVRRLARLPVPSRGRN